MPLGDDEDQPPRLVARKWRDDLRRRTRGMVPQATHRGRTAYDALAEQLRAKRLVLPVPQLEAIAGYHTALDNQLYKVIRAFR